MTADDTRNGGEGTGQALLYLTVVGARNRVMRRLRRLKQPRYAIALLVGLGYYALLFLPRGGSGGLGDPEIELAARAAGPLLIFAYLAWIWLRPGPAWALALSPAESQFLLGGPAPRAAVLRYRLARGQLGILFSAALFTLLAVGGSLSPPLRFIAMWTFFTTLQLHRAGAALVHAGAEASSARSKLARITPVIVFIAAGLSLAITIALGAGQLMQAAATGPAAFFRDFVDLLDRPSARYVLLPIKLAMAPLTAANAEWPRAILGGVGVLALNYLWVTRTDAAFEEAAAEAGRRRAAFARAARAGRATRRRSPGDRKRFRRTPLPLAADGPPSVALVWKNGVTAIRGLGRLVFPLVFVMLVPIVIVLASAGSRFPITGMIAILALLGAAFVTAMGPVAVSNDLRRDLANLGVLRSLPLPGRTIVVAEVAAAAVPLVAAETVLIVTAFLGVAVAQLAGGGWSGTAPTLVAAGIGLAMLPPVTMLGVAIQNGVALAFPAWIRPDTNRDSGIEFIGAQMLRLIGSLAVLAVALLGAGLLAALIWFAYASRLGTWAFAPAGIAAVGVLWLQVTLLVKWLGRLFERTELTDLEPG